MIRVLVDSNVLVDFLARRGDFYGLARKLMVFAEMGDYELWVSSSQVTDVFYVLSNGGRASCVPAAREALLALRRFVRVCAPGEREVDRALESDWPDFEDALVYQVATSIDAAVIVTRNARDFGRSAIPVRTPEEFFSWMERHNHVAYDEVAF